MTKTNGISIASWNVNGLRAVISKGFEAWLHDHRPLILGVQEIKCEEAQVSDFIERHTDDYQITLAPAQKKGYSGVGLFCHRSLLPQKIEIGLGIEKFDSEGRTIIAHYEKFIVFNCYFPNGQRDHGRVDYKLEYSYEVLEQALSLYKKTKKEIVIMGDVNTAHHPWDLANPKTNLNTTGFLPHERVFLDHCLERGLVDVFRLRHPEENGHYTWWTYRGDCRERNIGWRIDYFLTTQKLNQSVQKIEHLSHVLGSDHCPITMTFETGGI